LTLAPVSRRRWPQAAPSWQPDSRHSESRATSRRGGNRNSGLLGKLDDLHKGFDSGRARYWIIDLAAILLTLSALTGMVTLVSFRARRRSGFIVAALGVASIVALYLIWVPQ
jgi:hypothetical protein